MWIFGKFGISISFRHIDSLYTTSLPEYTNSIVIYDPFTNIDKIKLEKRYLKRFDIFIFCVSHAQIKKLNFKNIFNLKKVIFDLNHVIPKKILKKTKNYNKNIFVLGDYS